MHRHLGTLHFFVNVFCETLVSGMRGVEDMRRLFGIAIHAALRLPPCCALQEQRQLKFKYRCATFPATGEFYLLLYNDRFMASLMEVWHIVVHSTLR